VLELPCAQVVVVAVALHWTEQQPGMPAPCSVGEMCCCAAPCLMGGEVGDQTCFCIMLNNSLFCKYIF